MVGAAADDADRRLAWGRDRLVPLENLRIAEHGIERRAQLVAEAHHIAALGAVGGLGGFLGILQRCIGLLVRGDFLQEQVCSGGRIPPRPPAGCHGQARRTSRRCGDDRKDEEDDGDRGIDHLRRRRRGFAGLMGDQRQNGAQPGDGDCHRNGIAPEPARKRFDCAFGQQGPGKPWRPGRGSGHAACTCRGSGCRASSRASRSAPHRRDTRPYPPARTGAGRSSRSACRAPASSPAACGRDRSGPW